MRDTRADLTLATSARSPFLTYEPYYGLKEKPFSISADPRFLYKSRTHAPTFDELRVGIRRREGLIVLTGDIGTGKTTLCRAVIEALDRKTFCTIVPDPFVSREDLLKMLLIDFGVMSIEELKSGRLTGASRPELSYPLYEFLKSLVPLQAFAVLIIDEAQNLSTPLLEEIRILSDLEGPEKLLQVVLVGQLELRAKLKDPSMRQVDQRISVRCSLQALERDAVAGYIAHRLSIAGGGSDRVEFSAEAIDVICDASSGNPRLINLIADKSLYRGHIERTWSITPEIAANAVRDLGYALPKLSLDVSFPKLPAEAPPVAMSARDEMAEAVSCIDNGPQFLLQHHSLGTAEEPRDWRKLLRPGAILATMLVVLGGAGVVASRWQAQREELAQVLPMPAPPPAPEMPVSAGVAPVIPPADVFAPVRY
jgi:general secretion pathway protein A